MRSLWTGTEEHCAPLFPLPTSDPSLREGMRMGAVANLHRVKDAARVAWAVMNYTKHSMLVGEAGTISDNVIRRGSPLLKC